MEQPDVNVTEPSSKNPDEHIPIPNVQLQSGMLEDTSILFFRWGFSVGEFPPPLKPP
jgi:hypothetical protein